MKWFFERYKRHKTIILTVLAMVGTPPALVAVNVLEVADHLHDESRATLGKTPVKLPEQSTAPETGEHE